MNANVFRAFYFIVALLHIAAIIFIPNNNSIIAASKLMLMPVLIFWVFSSLRLQKNSSRLYLLLLALVFSLLGDFFLLDLIPGINSFILGLSSFLLAHISYTLLFTNSIKDLYHCFRVPVVVLSIFILLWAATVMYFLIPKLSDMLVPVSFYVLVIVLMVLSAISRYRRVSRQVFYLVAAGAISFLFSDMVIAINKFGSTIAHERIIVMSSYILAQYLITEGILQQYQNEQ